jgi:hypothetical protein
MDRYRNVYRDSLKQIVHWAAFEASVEESVTSESVDEYIKQHCDQLENKDEA